MKLYNSVGPNPHVVRMFAAEKGLILETQDIDIMAGANRQADYLNSIRPVSCLVWSWTMVRSSPKSRQSVNTSMRWVRVLR